MDECVQDTDGCVQTCTNNNGSFLCSCGTGYTLANDGLGCDGKSSTLIVYNNNYFSVHYIFRY